MNFQINALSETAFLALFKMNKTERVKHNIVKQIVTQANSTPCRISLKDAKIGDTVLLINYQHLAAATPFQASHAIYITAGATQAFSEKNTVPEMLQSRMISLRAFDRGHMMVQADIAQGQQIAEKIGQMLADNGVDYLHLHYAKQGCFAAKVSKC